MKNIVWLMSQLQWRCQGKYKLRSYVSGYVHDCLIWTRPVELLTLWCLSKGLERRQLAQKSLIALPKERKVLKDFVECHSLFREAGLLVNHYIFLVGSAVLGNLVGEVSLDALVECRPAARVSPEELQIMVQLRAGDAMFSREVDRRIELATRHHYSLKQAAAEAEALRSVTVKAMEARVLVHEFGNFLLVPVEFPERYYFHNWGYQGFTDRLLPITQPYPWRLSD